MKDKKDEMVAQIKKMTWLQLMSAEEDIIKFAYDEDGNTSLDEFPYLYDLWCEMKRTGYSNEYIDLQVLIEHEISLRIYFKLHEKIKIEETIKKYNL